MPTKPRCQRYCACSGMSEASSASSRPSTQARRKRHDERNDRHPAAGPGVATSPSIERAFLVMARYRCRIASVHLVADRRPAGGLACTGVLAAVHADATDLGGCTGAGAGELRATLIAFRGLFSVPLVL